MNSLKGKKILIVEDDLSSRLYLNKILEKYGVIILNAGDGQEALDIAMNNPDIDIILDGYSTSCYGWLYDSQKNQGIQKRYNYYCSDCLRSDGRKGKNHEFRI